MRANWWSTEWLCFVGLMWIGSHSLQNPYVIWTMDVYVCYVFFAEKHCTMLLWNSIFCMRNYYSMCSMCALFEHEWVSVCVCVCVWAVVCMLSRWVNTWFLSLLWYTRKFPMPLAVETHTQRDGRHTISFFHCSRLVACLPAILLNQHLKPYPS